MFARRRRGKNVGEDVYPCRHCQRDTTQAVVEQKIVRQLGWLMLATAYEAMLYCEICGTETILEGDEADRMLRRLRGGSGSIFPW